MRSFGVWIEKVLRGLLFLFSSIQFTNFAFAHVKGGIMGNFVDAHAKSPIIVQYNTFSFAHAMSGGILGFSPEA